MQLLQTERTYDELIQHMRENGYSESYLDAQLETTMRYLDISISDKAKAIATLQSETDPCIPKKWKNPHGSLKAFCGL